MSGASAKSQSAAGSRAQAYGNSVDIAATQADVTLSLLRQTCVWVLDAVVAFAVLYACLIVVDLPLMDAYPDHTFKTLRYPHLDNVYREEDYSRYHVNSYGLVGPEPAPLADTRIYRVAVFGDSFVEALQVPYARKFTTLLEGSIVPPHGKRRIEVWNFGHSADNTGNAYARWLRIASELRFDFIVFAFNEADVLENRLQDVRDRSGSFLLEDRSRGFRLGQLEGAADAPRFPALNEVLPRFHTFNYLLRTRTEDYLANSRRSLAHHLGVLRGERREPVSQDSPSATPEQLDNTFRQLRFVHQQIAGRGIPVALLALPTDAAAPPGFGSHQPDANRTYTMLTDRLRQAGVPLVDPYPAIASDIAGGNDPYSDWEFFHHFNARGHRLVAEVLCQYLTQHPELGLRVRNAETSLAHR